MIAKFYFDIARLRFVDVNTIRVNKGIVSLSNIPETKYHYCNNFIVREFGNSVGRHIPTSVFGYAQVQLSKNGIIKAQDFYVEFLSEFNLRCNHMQSLIAFLWLIKDNSIGIYGSYGQVPEMNLVSGKSKSFSSYTASGEMVDSYFTGNEVQVAGKLVEQYSQICGLSDDPDAPLNTMFEYNADFTSAKGIIPSIGSKFNYRNQTALDRAFHFLFIARSQSYLFYKISYYMACLEALFTSESSEITYRMSFRVSAYLESDPQKRNEIVETITDAYNIRSKFIHGQEIAEKKVKPDILLNLSVKVDEYLRRIFRMAIEKHSYIFTQCDGPQRAKCFNDLLLGKKININELKKEHDKARNRQCR